MQRWLFKGQGRYSGLWNRMGFVLFPDTCICLEGNKIVFTSKSGTGEVNLPSCWHHFWFASFFTGPVGQDYWKSNKPIAGCIFYQAKDSQYRNLGVPVFTAGKQKYSQTWKKYISTRLKVLQLQGSPVMFSIFLIDPATVFGFSPIYSYLRVSPNEDCGIYIWVNMLMYVSALRLQPAYEARDFQGK